jgi:hypothetical protein
METRKPARPSFFERHKAKFASALLAASISLSPSIASSQARGPEARQSARHHGSEAIEHRHPETERFSPGPLLILRSSAFRVRGALHEDLVNPRAVTPFNGGSSVTYVFGDAASSFYEYVARPEGNFAARITAMTLSAQYDYFRFKDVATATGEERELVGEGHAGSLTQSLAISAGISGIPIELVPYMNFGYRSWGLGDNIMLPGGESESVSLGSSEPYVGIYGLEIRFPSLPCEPASPIRFERLGLGAFGEPVNFFAYFTLSANYLANHRYRVRTLLTPQFTNFVSEPAIGAELLPVESTFYLEHGFISFAPGLRYEYAFPRRASVIEAFGEVRYFPRHAFGMAARAGWIGPVGDHNPEGEPSSPFGSLFLIFNIDGHSGADSSAGRILHGHPG